MAEYKDITPLKKQISDVKKAINSPNSDYMTGYICALSVTEGIIAELPTADVVEMRHGEWVLDEERYVRRVRQERLTKFVTFKCSECGQRKARNIRFKYCPNCGAQMGGKNENLL